MRPSTIFLSTLALAAAAVATSGSQPAFASWSPEQLSDWLNEHQISVPKHAKSSASDLQNLVAENWYSASAWTEDQYKNAQKTFSDVQDTSFETWDESRLREFLLRQGIVAPKGNREQLALLAKSQYKGYEAAAKSYSATAGSASAEASRTVESYASKASAAIAQLETDATRAIDRSKDYVFSTWDDNRLRSYLESKGLIKTSAEKKRDELLAMAEDYYNKASTPVWEAWSDSYMHDWLVSHDVIKSDFEKNRDKLRAQLESYYYTPADRVWTTWSDSELRGWLIKHGYVRSDTQISRDKMLKMVEENYLSVKDTVLSAWSDNQLRQWLIDNGYIRSDAEVKRDELVKLANEKFNDAWAKTASYLTWPDARLRAYLRERGVAENELPTNRSGLLQETRVRWVQAQGRAEAIVGKIRDIVNEGVGKAEDALYNIFNILNSKVYHGSEEASRVQEEETSELKGKKAEMEDRVGEKAEKVKAEL
ncbi:hypothetical protein AGABI1DRAFT_79948 [Agaricus bisporus var. burnettii JB137-S8]|uniref:Meiotic sister chromatid recombination protein 1 n=1 Tax=Agaricus bisporus var. burnettii (strain JB137-S8 / ATCC MYA-4627 / FGSC 10392) TaxID=597362 RepID=K5VLS7_AGABU|nr:uncharacterized protein AGABI1DRAFT_79948 [Agaricus bisporus var. burnettii JB137-S8]EKM75369.1 hypothetical protein AGABI1DRAFT_79948 [Agaricus bisporus var. burnettii JB137-S8]